jgi:hypothetical protein
MFSSSLLFCPDLTYEVWNTYWDKLYDIILLLSNIFLIMICFCYCFDTRTINITMFSSYMHIESILNELYIIFVQFLSVANAILIDWYMYVYDGFIMDTSWNLCFWNAFKMWNIYKLYTFWQKLYVELD